MPGSDHDAFRSSASIERLKQRAILIDAIRQFFREHGFLEVETPLIGRATVIDTHLDPFTLSIGSGHTGYLQTSPEFAMKRLLADRSGDIFQICKAFRRGEHGTLHNPEFTMLEWYRIGDDHEDQMRFTEKLVQHCFETADSLIDRQHRLPATFERITWRNAFAEATGIDPFEASTADIVEVAKIQRKSPPESLNDSDREGWLNWLQVQVVDPFLQKRPAIFLHSYPASQAALARVTNDSPPTAERFELYLHGVEIANGYHELTDANELRRRQKVAKDERSANEQETSPEEHLLLDAMDAGLPECAGVAVGLDRLIMLALRCDCLSDVIAFPWNRN